MPIFMATQSLDVCDFIIDKIEEISAQSQTKLIALDGRGGSGKSTLAQLLLQKKPDYKIIHLDSFPCRSDEHPFHPLGTQTTISVRRLLTEAILPLQKGVTARYARTPWWISEVHEPEQIIEIRAGGVVIIEGCYALSQELRDRYDLKIWVDRNPLEALADVLRRDGGEKDRIYWEQAYMPSEVNYIQSQSPMFCADILLTNDAHTFYLEGN